MTSKIVCNEQIHLYKGQMELTKLRKHCQQVFRVLPKKYTFYYMDCELDRISVNCQEDLDIGLEALGTKVFKKLYIQECNNLDEQSEIIKSVENPEQSLTDELTQGNYCKLPLWDTIKTINIAKQKIIEEEFFLAKQEMNKFLEEVEENVVEKVMKNQEKLVEQEIFNYMNQMIEQCHIDIEKDWKENHETVKKPTKQAEDNEQLINKIVDEKIKSIVPKLVNQITKTVQLRLQFDGHCTCCKKTSSSEQQKIGRKSLLEKVNLKYKEC